MLFIVLFEKRERKNYVKKRRRWKIYVKKKRGEKKALEDNFMIQNNDKGKK
jgi:hypothetical protein